MEKFVEKDPVPYVLFILQPTGLCNLNCSYCYLSEESRKNSEKMSLPVQKELIKKIANSKYSKNAHLCWHVGEPLTVGIAFYRNFFKMLQEEGGNANTIQYSMQSNGTLINEDWISLIKEYNIRLSLSLDGPAFIHNKNRVNWSGKGSHDRVQKSINLLREKDLPLKAICVLTNDSLDYPDELFNYFLENGFTDLSFNPEEQEGSNDKSSFLIQNSYNKTSLIKYKRFMTRIFDLWFLNRQKINIREFDSVMKHMISIREHKNNIHNSMCKPLSIISINMHGGISTFSPELIGGFRNNVQEFIFGNIFEINDFDDILANPKLQEVYQDIQIGISACKKTCSYFDICGGGAPSNKLSEHGTFKVTETTFCITHVKIIADIIQEKLDESEVQISDKQSFAKNIAIQLIT